MDARSDKNEKKDSHQIIAESLNNRNRGFHLVNAVIARDFELAGRLLKNGTSINEKRPSDGKTSLHAAATTYGADKNSEKMIRFVIEHGGDQTALSHSGVTPIALASIVQSWEAVELLVTLDNDRQKGTPKRIAALQYDRVLLEAVKAGKCDIAKKMLLHGASCQDSNNEKGNIALYWAVKNNHPDIVSLLLAYGADPLIKNKYGETILDLAKKSEQTACFERLQFHGFTARDVSYMALIKIYGKLKYHGNKYKEDENYIDAYRQYAQTISQALCENTFDVTSIQLAIDCLEVCHQTVFDAELKRLNARRNWFMKADSAQTYHSDPNVEISQLTALITFINTVLQYPLQDPPIQLLENQQSVEAIHARNYVETKKKINDYYARVRKYLHELDDAIKNRKWPVRKLGMWVNGMPDHMHQIRKILAKYLNGSNNNGQLMVGFAQVKSIIDNLMYLCSRHPDVKDFYSSAYITLSKISFATTESLSALPVVNTEIRQWTPASAPPMTVQTMIPTYPDLSFVPLVPISFDFPDQPVQTMAPSLTLPNGDIPPPTYEEHMKLKIGLAAEKGLPTMDYAYLADPTYQRIYPSVLSIASPMEIERSPETTVTFKQLPSVAARMEPAVVVQAAPLIVPEIVMPDNPSTTAKASEPATQKTDEELLRQTDEQALQAAIADLPNVPTNKPVLRVSQSDLYRRKPTREQSAPPATEEMKRRMVQAS